MQKIPFTKAHGARNDFLLTWESDVPPGDRRAMARSICDRHEGIGADGWLVVAEPAGKNPDGEHLSIHLYNADGSDSEISGNGTRCAAAFALDAGLAKDEVRIRTGAGLKTLWLKSATPGETIFEMHMGKARVDQLRHSLSLSTGTRESTVVNVGNPQCALLVPDFDLDWKSLGSEIETHQDFPNRTNVSFVRVATDNKIEVRFWERGVGVTESSGTGSTGAAAAALAHGLVRSPVTVLTPAGPLFIRCDGEEMYLTGPATIVARGEYFCLAS